MSTNMYMSDHKSLPESGKTGQECHCFIAQDALFTHKILFYI